MSYILDALKRAEQQRGGPARAIRAPRAFPTEAASRARWPWLAGGAAGMAVLVAAIALWPTTAPLPPASTSAPEDVSTIAAKPVPVARPAVGSSDVSRAASAPAAPPAAEPRPSPVIDRRAPERVAPPAAERSKISSLTPPPATVERGAARRPVAPPVVRSAPPPDERAAPPPEVARATPPRPSAPGPAAPAGDVKAMAAKISLQVLSWAPEPKDRFVFLNGRRYGEGQKVDDQLLVERILEDGVVLSLQGERVTLKGR
jgi:Type II secretion system protein B